VPIETSSAGLLFSSLNTSGFQTIASHFERRKFGARSAVDFPEVFRITPRGWWGGSGI
jgi:hypothetical protein